MNKMESFDTKTYKDTDMVVVIGGVFYYSDPTDSRDPNQSIEEARVFDSGDVDDFLLMNSILSYYNSETSKVKAEAKSINDCLREREVEIRVSGYLESSLPKELEIFFQTNADRLYRKRESVIAIMFVNGCMGYRRIVSGIESVKGRSLNQKEADRLFCIIYDKVCQLFFRG